MLAEPPLSGAYSLRSRGPVDMCDYPTLCGVSQKHRLRSACVSAAEDLSGFVGRRLGDQIFIEGCAMINRRTCPINPLRAIP